MDVSALWLFILVMTHALCQLPVIAFKGPGGKHGGGMWHGKNRMGKEMPSKAMQSPLHMSAFSSSYLPLKQRIPGKGNMGMKFPPLDMNPSLLPNMHPSKKMKMHFLKKKLHEKRKLPHMLLKKRLMQKKMGFPFNRRGLNGFRNGPAGAGSLTSGNIPGLGANQPLDTLSQQPGDNLNSGFGVNSVPNAPLSPGGSNRMQGVGAGGAIGVPGNGLNADIPYSIRSLGLGNGPDTGSKVVKSAEPSFELVPVTIDGNNVILGNANDVLTSKNRNPIKQTSNKPINDLGINLSTKIRGVDFASELKGGSHGAIDSIIPVHGIGKQSAVDIVPVTIGSNANVGGNGLVDIVPVNIGSNAHVGGNDIVVDRNLGAVNDFGGLGVTGLTTIENIPVGADTGSGVFSHDHPVIVGETSIGGGIGQGLDNSLNINGGIGVSDGGVLSGQTVGGGGGDGLPTHVTIDTVVGGPHSAERGGKNGGTWFRYSGYMSNIEPFGPGPYGECRLPSEVVCGTRHGWEHVKGMNEWCKSNCVVYMYSSYCDDDRCACKCVTGQITGQITN